MGQISLALFTGRHTPYGDAIGEIQIGSFREEFHLSTSYWTPRDYESQWREALHDLDLGASKGCLIASLDDPGSAGGRAFLWLFYRDGTDVVFQNQILLLADCDPPFVPSLAERWVPVRETVSEDGSPVSEWSVPFADLKFDVRIAD